MAFEVKSDLRFEISDLNYICSHGHVVSKCFLQINETNVGRK